MKRKMTEKQGLTRMTMSSKDLPKRVVKMKEVIKKKVRKTRSHKLKENLLMLRNTITLKGPLRTTLNQLSCMKLHSDNATTSKMISGKETLLCTTHTTSSFTLGSIRF